MNEGQERRDDSADPLVVLREVNTRVEADLIEALLRSEGIRCLVTGPEIYAYATGPTLVRVQARDLERAQEVIAEQEPEEKPATEDDFCPYCGEYLGDARESCPRCAQDISEWVALREQAPPAPIPAYAREHSTTWRFLLLLAVAAALAMLLTPWGREMGVALLRKAVEWAQRMYEAGGMM